MTEDEIAAMIADREAGTQKQWAVFRMYHNMEITGLVHVVTEGDDYPMAFVPSFADDCCAQEMEANARRIARVPDLEAEILRLRQALEIIAGKSQCIDNLMSNQDVALAALKGTDR